MNVRRLLPLAVLAVAGALASSAVSAQVYVIDERYDSPYDTYDRYDRYDSYDRYDDRYGYSDRMIDNRVERDLARVMGREGARINARVINGRVYLSGYVTTNRERRIATNVASRVPGVRAVYAADLYAGGYRYRPY